MTENEIGKVVVDAAVKVHRELGPGVVNGLSEENLGVFASLRETKVSSEKKGVSQ
jgi:hypothetical protein